MKLSILYTFAFALTPVISAVISDTSSKDRVIEKRDDADDFPDEVECPSTAEGIKKHEFKKEYMVNNALEWKDTLNNKKKVSSGAIVQGYPAKYSIGWKGAGEGTIAFKFHQNTLRMGFSKSCMDGIIWEIPMLANGEIWKKSGNNGDAGPYRVS